jgi:hypothetical protein
MKANEKSIIELTAFAAESYTVHKILEENNLILCPCHRKTREYRTQIGEGGEGA